MITKEAKIKCVVPWAGGKRTLAPRIVELLGPHHDYRELFVGGCSILPVKPVASQWEHINDANPAVVNVLRSLRDHERELRNLLDCYEFNKVIFQSAIDTVSRIDVVNNPVGFAACQLVVWWMGANGLAGTTTKQWFAQRHTKTGGDPSVRWESFKKSLPALSARLANVQITCDDFRNIVHTGREFADRPGVAIYADPPYFSKSFKYTCDFTAQDHADLAERLNQFKRARVVVSYYDQRDESGLFAGSSRLDELYPPDRWERHEVKVSKGSANARMGATKTEAVEVLLANRVKA